MIEMPQVPGVTHRFVEASGLRVHVAEAGAGEPVVLLHTFPQHWYAWRHVISELSTSYRLYALDMRGAGWSDAPRKGYDTLSRVGDVLAVMDALGLQQSRLIAHGWGAWTGFFTALRAPERFSHYLALSMAHPWPPHLATLATAWRQWHTALLEYPVLGRLVLRHWPGFTRFLLRHWNAEPAAGDDLAVYVDPSRKPANARAGQALNWQYVLHDIPRLALRRYRKLHLKVPTMILSGAADPLISPRLITSADDHADDLSVHIEPGAGHLLPEERPALVAQAARELFARPARAYV